MTSLDEPKHKHVKKPGWSELLALCAGITVAIIAIVTYVVMPITT